MEIPLTLQDIDVLLESLKYSKLNISNAPDTPYQVRQDNLLKVEVVEVKLRAARQATK